MPFVIPPLVWAALVGLGLAGGAVAVAASLWPQTKGKRLLVIGNTGSGKTTLVNFLRTGTIPEETRKTANTTTYEVKGEVRLGDLELKVDRIWDTAGDEEVTWRAWHDKARDADEILYLIHDEKASLAEHAATIRRDAQQISLWRQAGDLKNSCHVILVVTHCDKVDGFADLDARYEGATCADWARATPGVAAALLTLGSSTPLVAGSLVNAEAAGRLALRLLETVESLHD